MRKGVYLRTIRKSYAQKGNAIYCFVQTIWLFTDVLENNVPAQNTAKCAGQQQKAKYIVYAVHVVHMAHVARVVRVVVQQWCTCGENYGR
jgi:hypothetical protein